MAGNRIRDRFGTGHTTVLWGIAEATVTGNIIANELQDVRGTNIGGILYLAPAQVRSRARGASESLVPSPT